MKNREDKRVSKEKDVWSITKTEEFISYFIYSKSENQMIGSIYLTSDQATSLNQLMNHKKQDIVFLRK